MNASLVSPAVANSILPAVPPASTFRRSLVNQCVTSAREVLAELRIALPPFASWAPQQWDAAGEETREARECMLGWDVTDFGSNRFEDIGRILFTLRNGRANDAKYPKPYAEKLLVEPEGQRSPQHYHRSKREDIVNRGGGNVIVCLHPVGPDGLPGTGTLTVAVDGIARTVSAGEYIRLTPGESVAIAPFTYHQFWAEEGTGIAVGGRRFTVSSEVSSVCDDHNDNVFIEEWACRYPEVLEDEPRICYLCNEYPKLP